MLIFYKTTQRTIIFISVFSKILVLPFLLLTSCLDLKSSKNSDNAALDTSPKHLSSLEEITNRLPPIFTPEVTASVKIVNRSNLNLKEVHLNILDSNDNYFYSGNALGLKNLIQKSGLSIGGNNSIKIQKIYNNKTLETKLKVPKNKPLEIII